MFECKGKVFLTGVGKSGHIANKISATLSSTGTPSFFIHPAEALHGDLGMIEKSDLLVALSKSGESKEIIDLLPALKQNKIKILSITENSSSTIAASSIEHLEVKVNKEACPNGLAPTSSTTVMLALGDAIAVSLLKARGFTASDFAKSHPGGKAWKRLTLQVADLMIDIKKSALVSETSSLRDVIIEISRKKQGFALIKNKTNKIVGIFSDGDLRRQLQKSEDIDKIAVGMVMTKKYKTVDKNNLALNAAEIMSKHKIYSLIVEESNKIVGFITMHEILKQMLYKALFFLLAPFFVFSQEYEIKSDLVEIDTEENKLIYSGKVNFTSENISFQAEKLVIIQESEEFLAEGNPVELSYVEGEETIFGISKKLKMISGTIELYGDAELTRSDTKIISETIKINLENDKD